MSTLRLDRVVVTAPTVEGEITILRETSLTLTEQRIALVGPNGSGKSTLARLLNGLVSPASGRVTLDDLDVATDGREVRRRVGFMFTDPSSQLIMPTVVEDVMLSLRRTHRSARERREAAMGVLATYGLQGLADRSVHALSGGQRQLLALAGVLACEPEVVVADEPTTLLDLANARRVGDLLMSLPQQVVVCTHDLDLAERCDRALWIEDGAVRHDGPAAATVAAYRASVG
ncbi:ABC transporter ATP-binding protein [Nocardioides sp. Y6]|uniref:ABC transporter ATP-binding protein n=1 Tax=Nocardioides malaquae TaxID=2773426 RepID=A0ABR9RPC8_9ACTN|nr:ABC transporter ATP-binding protein [Nocardioides malaquae]MBE7323407.1 ABC transporter ATP-binding protein [Nocardioides malaquae]